MRHYFDRWIGPGCDFGLVWLRSNQLNPSNNHRLPMAPLLGTARIRSRHHAFLRHHLFLLSLAGSILPRIRHLAPRLSLSSPRRKSLRHNRPYSPRWSHRHYSNSSVALSGKLSQGTHRARQTLMHRHGTQTRSGASSKVRQSLRSSTLSQKRKRALQQSARPYQSFLTVWRRGNARKIPLSPPYWRTACAH